MEGGHPRTQYPWKNDSKFDLYEMEARSADVLATITEMIIPAGLLSKNCTNVLSTEENMWL